MYNVLGGGECLLQFFSSLPLLQRLLKGPGNDFTMFINTSCSASLPHCFLPRTVHLFLNWKSRSYQRTLKIQRYCDAMCCPVMDGIYVEIIASELLGEEYLFLKSTLEKWKENGFWSYKDKSLNPAPVIY